MVTELEEPIGADATPEERRAKHLSRVDSLLDHAGELLQKSRMTGADRLQVSEKIWGSVTHTLKAIAATRGWVFPYGASDRFVQGIPSEPVGRPADQRTIRLSTQPSHQLL